MTEDRSARINRADGEPLGASLFLSPTELQDLGVDPACKQVEFRVEDGELCISGGDSE